MVTYNESVTNYKPWLWKEPEGVGKRGLRRKDGLEKATGKALYTRDIYRPNMLYGKPLLSPYAHAKIVSMDTNKAASHPGVRAILRYDEPGVNIKTPNPIFGGMSDTLPGEANKWNEPVGAIVVAETELACDEALRLIEIKWEEKPFIIDWEKCLEPNAPLLRPDLNPKNNIKFSKLEEYGSIEKGFKEADQILEWKVTAERDVWACTEAYAGLAEWRGDELECWYPGQNVTSAQATWSIHSGRAQNKTNVCYGGAHMGGLSWTPWDKVPGHWAIVAAKRTGRPCKILNDTSHFYGAEDRAGSYNFKVGFRNDGTITAVDIKTIYCAQTVHDCLIKIREGTKIENYRYQDTTPYDNTSYIICARHGSPATMVVSQIFGKVADALKMDVFEVGYKNDGCVGHPMSYINEHIKKEEGRPNFDSDSFKDVVKVAKEAIGYDTKKHAPGEKVLPNGRLHGIGGYTVIHWSHISQLGVAMAGFKMMPDGTATLLGRHGDNGWGAETTYCQLAAAEAGLKYDDVTLRPFGETGFEFRTGGGSCGIHPNGEASVKVGRAMKKLLCEYAVKPIPGGQAYGTAEQPSMPALFNGVNADELDVKDGEIFFRADPSRKFPVGKLTSLWYDPFAGATPFFTWDLSGIQPAGECTARQAHILEVEVDPETGEIFVVQHASAQDIGKVISPEICEGQSYGGAIMGISRCLSEREFFDPATGVMLNDNLCGYALATIHDFGKKPNVNFVENRLGYGIYGIYGIGESGSAVGAVLGALAVHNATGKWINDFPITPEKVLKALGKV